MVQRGRPQAENNGLIERQKLDVRPAEAAGACEDGIENEKATQKKEL